MDVIIRSNVATGETCKTALAYYTTSAVKGDGAAVVASIPITKEDIGRHSKMSQIILTQDNLSLVNNQIIRLLICHSSVRYFRTA